MVAPAEQLPRSLTAALHRHLAELRQMAFVVGPRQVGKTSATRTLVDEQHYLNWDDEDDRALITSGPTAIATHVGLEELHAEPVVLVLDELHKYRRWRTILKGLFDRHAAALRIVVTGSSRLDFYRKGGDSLMGRYFVYRLHPLSVGELLDASASEELLRQPRSIDAGTWERLYSFGGFPEPYLRADRRFSLRWQRLRIEQLVRGDVRDLTRIQDVDQLALLTRVLASHSGSAVNYSNLANEVRTSVDTVRRWIDALESLYHGFVVRPWHRNVARSLRKEPKWYLRDWSAIEDPGAR
ncbi:MAG: ATP-binding protein, partial [Planctomycetes bacterium]|nr:ATP-binding protein [Planctomycetota bacterium]